MKTNTHHWLIAVATTLAATAFLANSSFAETPNSAAEDNTGYVMPGMYGGMGPWNMGPGMMGPGMMGQGMMGYGHMWPGNMGMMQALNMDKAQRSKLRSIMHEQRSANCKTMSEMMHIRDELAAEYDKDVPDAKTIGKLYNKMATMQQHMIEQSVEMHNRIRGLLNKDQQKKYDDMFHGGMMGGNGSMMGPGGMMQ